MCFHISPTLAPVNALARGTVRRMVAGRASLTGPGRPALFTGEEADHPLEDFRVAGEIPLDQFFDPLPKHRENLNTHYGLSMDKKPSTPLRRIVKSI